MTGEVIYIGKTNGNLFTEIDQRYNQKCINFRVIGSDGKPKWKEWPIRDIAQWVSAYGIEDALITNIEALLTRVLINTASNIRTEQFIAAARE
jgi:hypothetical protein